MTEKKLEIVVCRTCVRDNPGEWPFVDPATAEKIYRENLNEKGLKDIVNFRMQNCFAECENYYCVELSGKGIGFRLKKISDMQKINAVVECLGRAQESPHFRLSDSLQPHLIEAFTPES